MKRPVSLTVEVDDDKPQGWALMWKDGSLSSKYFYTIDDLDYSISDKYEKQAFDRVLLSRFKERYLQHYKQNDVMHAECMRVIEQEMTGCKCVPVWFYTTRANGETDFVQVRG